MFQVILPTLSAERQGLPLTKKSKFVRTGVHNISLIRNAAELFWFVEETVTATEDMNWENRKKSQAMDFQRDIICRIFLDIHYLWKGSSPNMGKGFQNTMNFESGFK